MREEAHLVPELAPFVVPIEVLAFRRLPKRAVDRKFRRVSFAIAILALDIGSGTKNRGRRCGLRLIGIRFWLHGVGFVVARFLLGFGADFL